MPSASQPADRPFARPGEVASVRHWRADGWFWDQLAYFCLLGGVFTLSWHIVRFGEANLTLSDGFFLVAVVTLVARGKLNSQPFGPITPLWFFAFILLIGGLFLSSVINGAALRWVSVAAQYSFAFIVVPMMLASWRRLTLDRCIVFFALGVCLSQLLALIASSFLTYYDTAPLLGNDFITGTGRVGALSGNSNTNGAMASFCLLAILYSAYRSLMPKWLLLLCAGLAIWGLVASASFTSFTLGCVSLLVALFILWPARTIILGIPIIAAFAVLLVSDVPLPDAFEQRVASALTEGDLDQAGTFTGRLEMAIEAWRLSSHTAFIGFGADGYRQVSVYQAPVHVLPLLLLTEGGLLSLLGFIIILMTLWGLACSILRKDRVDAAFVVGMLIVFTGFTLAVPHMYARMWIVPVLLGLIHALKWRPYVPGTGRTTWKRAAAPQHDLADAFSEAAPSRK
jgi:O-antigen ligase